jgi:hypothetical protein
MESPLPDFSFIAEYPKSPKDLAIKGIGLTIGFPFLFLIYKTLFVNGISRLLDLMFIGIYCLFVSLWFFAIYNEFTKLVAIEFFPKHLVVKQKFSSPKTYYYDEVKDLNFNAVKIGKQVFRFTRFSNRIDLHNCFTRLIGMRRLNEKLFSGEIEREDSTAQKVGCISLPLSGLVTVILSSIFPFDYPESRLLQVFVFMGLMWIFYWLIKIRDAI